MRQLACLLLESPAPGEAGRLRRRPGPHLRDGPLQHSPALGEAWAGNVTNFPIPGELAAPGVPRGGGVGGDDAPSPARDRRGNVGNSRES